METDYEIFIERIRIDGKVCFAEGVFRHAGFKTAACLVEALGKEIVGGLIRFHYHLTEGPRKSGIGAAVIISGCGYHLRSERLRGAINY